MQVGLLGFLVDRPVATDHCGVFAIINALRLNGALPEQTNELVSFCADSNTLHRL